ncbi:DUF2188 domain-containing protein, partial [Pyxidicoccus sp. 3LFB2]
MAKNKSRSGGVHTTPNPEGAGWVNQMKGAVTSKHRLKERAVEAGRELAQERKTEHTIHNLDAASARRTATGAIRASRRGSGLAGAVVGWGGGGGRQVAGG